MTEDKTTNRRLSDEEIDAIIDYVIAVAPRTATLDVDPDTGPLRIEFPKVEDGHETH